MPKFVARLEAQDGSGHYRRTVGVFDTKEEFKQLLTDRENGYTVYRLDTEELADLEKKEADAANNGLQLTPKDRQELVYHRQEKPYKLVSIEEEVA